MQSTQYLSNIIKPPMLLIYLVKTNPDMKYKLAFDHLEGNYTDLVHQEIIEPTYEAAARFRSVLKRFLPEKWFENIL